VITCAVLYFVNSCSCVCSPFHFGSTIVVQLEIFHRFSFSFLLLSRNCEIFVFFVHWKWLYSIDLGSFSFLVFFLMRCMYPFDFAGGNPLETERGGFRGWCFFYLFFSRLATKKKKEVLTDQPKLPCHERRYVQDRQSEGMTLQDELLSTLVSSFLLIAFVRPFGGTRQIMSKHSVRSRVL